MIHTISYMLSVIRLTVVELTTLNRLPRTAVEPRQIAGRKPKYYESALKLMDGKVIKLIKTEKNANDARGVTVALGRILYNKGWKLTRNVDRSDTNIWYLGAKKINGQEIEESKA